MSGSDPETCAIGWSLEEFADNLTLHKDWDAFYEYLKVYQVGTHQLFRLARRNAEIKAHAGANSSPELTPDDFKTFWLKLICTHGSRSTGQRKSIFNKSTQRKADVEAAVTWNSEIQRLAVHIIGCSTDHNHRVDVAAFANHPSARRVEDPVLLAFVDVLQSAGSKPKRIVQFLRP